MEVSVDATSSLSPDDSPANTDESDSESRSTNSDETVSESDSSKQVKVAAAAAATGITFDFGASNVVKLDILAMEIHARYFSKGHGRLPGAKTVPTPRANEAVVFEDLFTTGLRMPPHPVLAG
jgi:orotate phosphoribosyltransferase